jgi:hypothetical protein
VLNAATTATPTNFHTFVYLVPKAACKPTGWLTAQTYAYLELHEPENVSRYRRCGHKNQCGIRVCERCQTIAALHRASELTALNYAFQLAFPQHRKNVWSGTLKILDIPLTDLHTATETLYSASCKVLRQLHPTAAYQQFEASASTKAPGLTHPQVHIVLWDSTGSIRKSQVRELWSRALRGSGLCPAPALSWSKVKSIEYLDYISQPFPFPLNVDHSQWLKYVDALKGQKVRRLRMSPVFKKLQQLSVTVSLTAVKSKRD